MLVETISLSPLEKPTENRTYSKKPWNDDSPVNTNEQWFPMVSKWCEMDFVHPQYFLEQLGDSLCTGCFGIFLPSPGLHCALAYPVHLKNLGGMIGNGAVLVREMGFVGLGSKAQLFSDPAKKGDMFLGKTMLSGAATQKKGKRCH